MSRTLEQILAAEKPDVVTMSKINRYPAPCPSTETLI